jgi:hypothetical protein
MVGVPRWGVSFQLKYALDFLIESSALLFSIYIYE